MKPHLRAQMEADMNRIARGELSKEDALRSCLEDMRGTYKIYFACTKSSSEVFKACVQDSVKLDEAIAKHYVNNQDDMPTMVVLLAHFSKCGRCDELMDLTKDNGDNRFVACSACQDKFLLPPRGDLTANTKICVICNFQVINVVSNDTNKSHTICPKCFR